MTGRRMPRPPLGELGAFAFRVPDRTCPSGDWLRDGAALTVGPRYKRHGIFASCMMVLCKFRRRVRFAVFRLSDSEAAVSKGLDKSTGLLTVEFRLVIWRRKSPRELDVYTLDFDFQVRPDPITWDVFEDHPGEDGKRSWIGSKSLQGQSQGDFVAPSL